MTLWLMRSMINVSEAVHWHLGCWPSPAVQEEGAADRSLLVYTSVVYLLEATSKMDAGSRKD